MTSGGWEGHEPEQTTDRFAAILRREGFEVTVSRSLDVYTDREAMGRADLVVQTWTQGEMTREQVRGLQDAVAGGCGLAGWHGGIIDSSRNSPDYQFMTGGQWVAHPDNIIDYEVVPVPGERDHPIMEGIGRFSMHSEQYYCLVDPSNRVLATTTFAARKQAPWVEGTVMPVVWTRFWGRGRVFVNALGHVDADFDVPEAEEITRRGLLWAARRSDG